MEALKQQSVKQNIFIDNITFESKEFPALNEIKIKAKNRFIKTGFPSPRDDDWKYTNLGILSKTNFKNSSFADKPLLIRDEYKISKCLAEIAVINGHLISTESETKKLPQGIKIFSLKEWFKEKGSLPDSLIESEKSLSGDAIVSLNVACLKDVIIIEVDENTVINSPIHIIHLIEETIPSITASRTIVISGKNSKVSVIESHYSNTKETTLAIPQTDFYLKEDSTIEHCRNIDQSDQTYHINPVQSIQEKKSSLRSTITTTSSKIARHQIKALLNGEDIETEFYGLAMPGSGQLVDHDLTIDHAFPNCKSWEFFRGILGEKAKSAFRGKIYVHEGAHGTDAKQTNQSLLLSDDADAFSRPQLEIYADDVKCTHGATVGQMDQVALHYLMARGIPRELATSMLVLAFCNEVLEKIDHKPLREKSTRRVLDRLPSGSLLLENV